MQYGHTVCIVWLIELTLWLLAWPSGYLWAGILRVRRDGATFALMCLCPLPAPRKAWALLETRRTPMCFCQGHQKDWAPPQMQCREQRIQPGDTMSILKLY